MHVKIMVKVVKRQPADHSTKGTVSAVLTTYHVSYAHAQCLVIKSRTAVQRSTCARMNPARKEHRMILWRIMTKTEN